MKKAILTIIILMLPLSCFAQDLSLIQMIMYKEVKLMLTNGIETPVLVNRFTGKVEYRWTPRKWVEANPNWQKIYDNQRNIRKMVGKQGRR